MIIDGKEWRMVPVEATDAMVDAAVGNLIDVDGFFRVLRAINAAIAAAPAPPVVEVSDEMLVRAFNHGMPHPRMATRYDKQVGMEWLDAWRAELGPMLGLVTREEMAREVEASYRDGHGDGVQSERNLCQNDESYNINDDWRNSDARKRLESSSG